MNYKVLIVDDETATVFGLKALLENDQVEVLTAVSAQAAKKILRSEKVNVVLSDIRLSGDSGRRRPGPSRICKRNVPMPGSF